MVTAASDAFIREIVRNKLLALTNEMGAVLSRTSMSPIVYEVLDFACGICDAAGRVVAQDNGLCLFTGTFRPQVESIIAKWPLETMQPGDIYMTNSAYAGGTHNADVALVQPIFADGRPIAFGISVTHWTEIGGKVLGSLAPDSTDVFQEGLQFPQLLLYRDGVANQAIIDIIRANVRLPMMSIGDLNAGVAAARIADTRLSEVIARYGSDVVLETFETILNHGEALARKGLGSIPDGVYEADDVIDGDGVSDAPIPVRLKLTVTADAFVADFTGSSPQTGGPVNCARGALMSGCKTIFKAIVAPNEPSNEGLFRPLEVICPDGTIFTATRPAPTGWYFESSSFATELIWKALAPVLPRQLSAGSYVSLCAYYIGGRDETGNYWVLATPQDGGWGACADRDGESSLIATTDGDTYNYPAEVVEAAFPLTMLRNSFNAEAGGGAGEHRGGFGTIREYRIEAPGGGTLLASMGRNVHVPWGVDGGENGTANYFEILKPDGETVRGGRVTDYPLQPGDVVRIVTGNGGGWGDPKARGHERVAQDVRDGLIAPSEARSTYGIEVAS
jgi:N-methylhydantoinase B